jgi:chemotaxis protein MotC
VRRLRLAAAWAAITLGAGVPAGAQTISELTSDLQALQANIAAGDKTAYAEQSGRITAIGAAIGAAKPEVWQTKSETDAIVIYLLSGGESREIVHLLESGAVPTSEAPLIRGALAYVLGNEGEAVKRLAGLDPHSLELRLAGPVAFAQSVLETKRDPAKAIALLDLARLLAPGTLIEEAALRRETMLASDQRNVDRVALLSRQYATRFGASVYADNFLQSLADALTQTGTVDSPANFAKFSALFAALPPDTRRGFLLSIARTAVLDGKIEVAGAATGGALSVVAADSPDEARCKLYQGMARIMTPEYDSGLAELQNVVVARLDRRDQELLASARGIAAFLRQPLSDSVLHPDAAAPPPVAGDKDAATQTIALAEASLERTASLILPMAPASAGSTLGASASADAGSSAAGTNKASPADKAAPGEKGSL